MMGINYLEAAKNQILAIEGEHPVEEVQVRALTAIADVLIHTAMKDEHMCHIKEDEDRGIQVCSECGWSLSTHKGAVVRMHGNYCPNCGAKVVEV